MGEDVAAAQTEGGEEAGKRFLSKKKKNKHNKNNKQEKLAS